ncbi:GAF domain-containing protein [Flaviaesturariibacter flavus]|uniref:GAF domain-containing protein n=1 Tax=Flaviaesturariibacter flavus TaxID=2502780 RepID=UPI0014043BC1|nr:GAF domain-containing protein [Flaviaesturariibacter flavus]
MDQANPVSANGRVNYDSEFCGRVPLNQTNLVQPHGVLLVLDRDSLNVLQCSENAEDIFGIAAADLAGKPLADFFTKEQFARLRERLVAGVEGKFPLQASVNGRDFLFVVESNDGFLLLEAEPVSAEPISFVDVYEQLKYVMAAIEGTSTVEEAAGLVARELKNFSGFDKVMIYRFDRDWNGEVIAEEREEGMESYMNQFFPASDIPKQARELYRKNPYRLIPNIDYTPVKLYPVLNPVTHSFTNLSNSNLRSVAGVHLEYLRNMNVQASMSTRILKDGRLWGLIACHHRTPRYLSYQHCSVFELLSTFITSRIGAIENAEVEAARAEGLLQLSRVVDSVLDANSLAEGLGRQSELVLQLLSADGFSLVHNRKVYSWGLAPDSTEVQDLAYWLQTHSVDKLRQEASLAQVFEPAAAYAATASGLLALPLQPERGNYLLGFRREAIRRINWSGNPNEAVQFEADGRRYHPRNSFKVWQQKVEHTAPEWSETEEWLVDNFRQFLVEFLLRQLPG